MGPHPAPTAAAPPARPQARLAHILARNTVWNYAGLVVNIVTNLLLFPFVVGQIGEASAGVWLLLGSLTGYMGLFELGLVPSLTQHVAAALATNDRTAVNRLATTGLAVLVLLMLAALQLLWAVPAVVGVLQVPAGLESDALAMFAIAIAGFALRMPLATFQALLLGAQRQDRCNQLWIGMAAIKAALTIALLASGRGIVAVVLMEAVVHLAAGAFQIVWSRQEVPTLRFRPSSVSVGDARRLVAFGGAVVLMSLSSLVIEQTDRFVVGAFRPIAEVTLYAAAWKLYMLVFLLPTTLLQAVAPLAASLHGGGDAAALRRLFLFMTKCSAAVALPVGLSVALCAEVLLRVWMGAAFVDAAAVVHVLSAAFLVSVFNHAGYSVLTGMKRVAPMVWLYHGPQAILNVVLSVVLVQRFGYVGVAVGTALPVVLLEWPFLAFLLGTVGVSWRRFFREAVAPASGPALVFLALVAARWMLGVDHLALPLVAAACGLVHAAVFWSRSLGVEEKQQALALARRRLAPPARGPA